MDSFVRKLVCDVAVLKSTQNANVTFLGCTMSDNEARFEGGVLVLEGTSSAYIHTCEMMSNTAGVDGGVMHITNMASATFEEYVMSPSLICCFSAAVLCVSIAGTKLMQWGYHPCARKFHAF